jgi:putative spermidine/putrescine transport system substrate-binding protein
MGSALSTSRPASADVTMVGVEWGSPYIDATKAALAKYSGANVTWELHQNGAAAILAKIKATWPNTAYSIIDMWSPVFVSCMKEGWSEPVTFDEVPNLADVPPSFITKDKDGRSFNIPRNINVTCFAVRKDTVPIEIKTIHDLYDPKLKGQIAWPDATQNTSLQVVGLAYANGGDEYHMEPGWNALKELAKTGNIGRIVSNDSDMVNTISSGETSVIYSTLGTLSAAAKNVPLSYLTKTDPSIKSALAIEGWVVLKSAKDKKAAFDLLNFLVAPEAEASFCKALSVPPANSKATPTPGLEFATYSPDEASKFTYTPDYGYISTQLDAWQKRFQNDILPLIGH